MTSRSNRLSPNGSVRQSYDVQSSDELLLFGLQFADGRVWTNMLREYPTWDQRPDGVVVVDRGGSDGRGEWHMNHWVWPLPPDGDLTFYAAWLAVGIAEISGVIDATELRQRSLESKPLWP
ncbi:MAG: hypothetical protein JWN99_2679 [Ilumatobacteraceae bacterium]|nr:hypothetical protein [Ilumatobacteraceae bacterium]